MRIYQGWTYFIFVSSAELKNNCFLSKNYTVRGVFRTQSNIYDEAHFAKTFHDKYDIWLCSKYASDSNIWNSALYLVH